jgi:hypothetical protein
MIQQIDNRHQGESLPMTTLEEKILDKMNEIVDKLNELGEKK